MEQTQKPCGYLTLDGTPCQNPIGPWTTICAAGHPVVASGTPAAAGSAGLSPEQAATQATESFDAEELLGLAPAMTDEEAMAAAVDAALALPPDQANIFIASVAREVNINPALVSYDGRVTGIRPRLTEGGTATFTVDRFAVAAGTPFVIGLGDPAGSMSLNIELPCTEEICTDHAYIRLDSEAFSQGLPEDRTKAFAAGVVAATSKGANAKCPAHRLPLEKPIIQDGAE